MLKKSSFFILGTLYHCYGFAIESKIGYEVSGSGLTLTGQHDIISNNDTDLVYGIYYKNTTASALIDLNKLVLNAVNSNTSNTYNDATGIYIYGSNDISNRPQVNLGSDSQINVKALGPVGINLKNTSLTGNNLSITTSGAKGRSYGLFASDVNIDLTGTTNITMITNNVSSDSAGIYLENNSTFNADKVNINITSKSIYPFVQLLGIKVYNSKADLGNGSIIRIQEGAQGIENTYGISINGGSVIAKNLTIDLGLALGNSFGVLIYNGSFTMDGGSITSSGKGISTGSVSPTPSDYTHRIDLKDVTIDSKNVAIGTGEGLTTLNNVSATSTNKSALYVYKGTVQAKNVVLAGDDNVIDSTISDIVLSGNNIIRVNDPQYPSVNAIKAIRNSNITTTVDGSVLQIVGNIDSTDSTVDLKMNGGSEFIGKTVLTSTGNNTAIINLDMTDSFWQMKDSSTLTKLGLNNTTVNFTNANYTTLTTEQVSGQGLFKMKTDIAMQLGDLLKVTDTSSGNHHLDIQNEANSQTTGTETLTVVETADGNADFSLAHQVEAGGYKYNLRKADNGTDWELYRAPQHSQSSSAIAGASFFNTSHLLNYVDNQTLLQRLGDLRLADSNKKQGVFWMKSFGGKLSSFAASNLSGFDMPYWGTQLGIDTALDNSSGTWLVGGMVGYTRANPNYKVGHGNSKNYSIGLYTTYLHDNGFYIDGLLKYNAIHNQFNVKDTDNKSVKGNGRTQGMSASFEIGQRIWLTNQHSGFYLEPQAQLAIGWQGGDTVKADNGLHIKLSAYNTTLGRTSLIAGYQTQNENPVTIYLKSGYMHEFSGNTNYRLNGSKEKYSFKGELWDNGIGVATNINKVHHVYVDATYAKGNRFDQKQLNLGYRYSF